MKICGIFKHNFQTVLLKKVIKQNRRI